MGKLSINSMLIVGVIMLAMLGVFSSARKVTKIHFYVQDILAGPNQSVWEVARAEITSTSATSFGLVRVADDQITAGSDANSTKLGRLQGQVTFAGLEESAPLMSLVVVFQSGSYNGSTIWLLGRTPASDQREYAIVGGTGVFRMAQGYAITSTYSIDMATGRVVLEYTLFVAQSHGVFIGKSSKLSHM